MLLVADVGNTHVHLGLFRGESLLAHRSIPGERVLDLGEEWAAFTAPVGGAEAVHVEACVVCSVSPKTKIPLRHWLTRQLGLKPLVVGEHIPFPMPIEVEDEREVGADRVVNAYAAWRLVGSGPIVVCDFGTAITLDVVSAHGAYQGGVIAPGIETAARALAHETALLPYVRVERCERAIGRSTIDAMQGGLYFGMLGLVDALCEKVSEELGEAPHFLATGGDAALIAERSRFLSSVHPDLTLQGLRLAWEAHRGASS